MAIVTIQIGDEVMVEGKQGWWTVADIIPDICGKPYAVWKVDKETGKVLDEITAPVPFSDIYAVKLKGSK